MSSPGTEILHVVRLTVARSDQERVETWLDEIGVEMTVIERVDLPETICEAYHPTRAGAEAQRRVLEVAFRRDLPELGLSFTLHELKNEDWAEYWKQFFHAERVSDRIIVRPSWERLPLRPGDVDIEIDPGMSFGTGQHPTTRSCLGFLDEVSKAGAPGSLADIGCGSGILMIAAVKLGFTPVFGMDNDLVAVDVAMENCAKNGVAQGVRCDAGDLAVWQGGGRWDVICANILAPTLIDYAAVLVAGLRKSAGARLFVSGILTAQWAAVAAAFESRGMVSAGTTLHPEWTSGSFRWR